MGFVRIITPRALRWPHWLLMLGLLALAIRLPIGLQAPPFVDLDTRQYLKPAFNLLSGNDLGLTLRRTPGYPLFLAAGLWFFQADFRGILLLQHALGVGVVLLTAELGRRLYDQWVALTAGLLIALSAPLLISEHALLTETVFSFLLMLACVALVRALQARRLAGRQLALGGLLLGLATLCRPVGELLIPLPALVCLLQGRCWREALRLAAYTTAGAAVALGPWMAYNWAVHGVFEVTHATGEVLITHTAVYGRGRYALASVGQAGETSEQAAARRVVIAATLGDEAKGRTMYGPRLTEALMRELGVSEVAADDLLRDLAIEQIGGRPLIYLTLLSENAWRVFAGRPADLEYAWQSSASEAWGPSLPIHPRPASDAQDSWLDQLNLLTRIYDPARLALPLAGLFVLGLGSAVVERRSGLALLPALGAIILLLASAALVGTEYRFRYPADPLLTVVGMGGWRWLSRHFKRAQRRVDQTARVADCPVRRHDPSHPAPRSTAI